MTSQTWIPRYTYVIGNVDAVRLQGDTVDSHPSSVMWGRKIQAEGESRSPHVFIPANSVKQSSAPFLNPRSNSPVYRIFKSLNDLPLITSQRTATSTSHQGNCISQSKGREHSCLLTRVFLKENKAILHCWPAWTPSHVRTASCEHVTWTISGTKQ